MAEFTVPRLELTTIAAGEMHGSLSDTGRYFPAIPYAEMEDISAIRIDPEVLEPTVQRHVVTTYSVPAEFPRALVRNLGIRLIQGADVWNANAAPRQNWVLAPYNLLFPGLVPSQMSSHLDVNVVELDIETARYWSDGATRTRTTVDGVTTYSDWVLPTPATVAALNARANEFQIPGMPYITRSAIDPGTDLDLAALMGMLLYAVIKTPDGNNNEGFTERRPLAAAQSIGRRTPIPESLKPSLDMYRIFNSILVSSPAVRIPLCRTVCRWVHRGVTDSLRGAVIAQVRIWRDHQLTGFKETRRFMFRAGEAVRRVGALAADVNAFRTYTALYSLMAKGRPADPARGISEIPPNPLVDYHSAIYGPLSLLKQADQFSGITMLMRDIKRLETVGAEQRRWNFFAATVPADMSYDAELRAALAATGISLPRRVASSSIAESQ